MEGSGLTKPTPLEFHGNVARKWKVWKNEFEIYMEASGGTEKTPARQKAIFLNLIGKEGREVAENFKYSSDETITVDILKEKFEAYATPRKNTMYVRYTLLAMKKFEDETVDQFANRLKNVAKDGGYGDHLELMVRDCIVFGITDDVLKERILENDDLPLEKVLDMVRASETSKAQMKFMKGETEKELEMQALERRKHRKDSKECTKCGYSHDMSRTCPAYGKKCMKCNGYNHFASKCNEKKERKTFNRRKEGSRREAYSKRRVQLVQEMTSESDSETTSDRETLDEFFLGQLHIGEMKQVGTVGTGWFEKLKLGNYDMVFKLDTGAEVNVIPMTEFEKMNDTPPLRKTQVVLTGYGGKRVRPQGRVKLRVEANNKEMTVPFLVADVKAGPVLGLDTCVKFGLISRNTSYKCHELREELPDEEKIITQFKDVFKGIGCYSGKIHLEVDPDVRPVIHPPRKIPVSVQKKAKDTLESLMKQGIIEKVDHPTEWVHNLVMVEKPNGKLRVCLDPRDLNKALKREHYKIPTADEIFTKLQGMKYFTVIDQKWGYWNLQLDEESKDLCTFNSPLGRFRFTRLPFGLSVAPEIFQKRNDKEFGNIPAVGISTDDFIIGGKTKRGCIDNVKRVLERAREVNTKFNTEKIQFCKPSVKYVGRIISGTGISMDPTKVEGIASLQHPENKAELRTLLGMINYLTPFIPSLADMTAPMRQLMKNNVEFQWDNNLQKSFDELKEAITKGTELSHFDPQKKIVVQADASQYGLGGCLLQNNNPIAYTSRALLDAETRYAQIEKEFLAIVQACEKFHYYVYGYPIEVHTDHKPLIAIMNKPLDKITPRLQRFVMRLQRYDAKLVYKPGKELHVADLLSRNFTKDQSEKALSNDEHTFEGIIHEVVNEPCMISKKWRDIIGNAMKNDPEAQALRQLITEGWPAHKRQVTLVAQKFWNSKMEFSVTGELILCGQKIFVPSALRSKVLQLLHETHQGIEKSKTRARQVVYWPKMGKDIETMITACSICQRFKPKNPGEPLMPHPVPDLPWEKVGMDIFDLESKSYLVIVDYFSKFPEVSRLADKTAKSVIVVCKEMFGRYGIPAEIVCDNMPFGSQEFRRFCAEWDIKLTTSSPRFPQSNGMAERFVKTVKTLFKKAFLSGVDPELALMEYRNTPVTGMTYTPAQLLHSRTLRGKLPVLTKLLQPSTCTDVKKKLVERQSTQKRYYDVGKTPMKQLKTGDVCRIRDDKEWRPGKIIAKADAPRSYLVMNEEGNIIRRNRRHLNKTGEDFSPNGRVSNLPENPKRDSKENPSAAETLIPVEQKHAIAKTYTTKSGRTTKLPSKYKDFVT